MEQMPSWGLWLLTAIVGWLILKTVFGIRILGERLSSKFGAKYPTVILFILLPLFLGGELALWNLFLNKTYDQDMSNGFTGLALLFFIIFSFWIMFSEREFSYWDKETKSGKRDKRFKDNELNVIPQSERSRYLCHFYKYMIIVSVGLFLLVKYYSQ